MLKLQKKQKLQSLKDSNITLTSLLIRISGLDSPPIDVQLADMKNEVTELCKMLLKQKFTRDRYKELVTLVLC